MGKSIRDNGDPFVLDDQDVRNVPSAKRPAPGPGKKEVPAPAADPFVLDKGDAPFVKKKVGGSASGAGSFPTPSGLLSAESVSRATKNYQDKTLTPEDQRILAQTDWGKTKGLDMPADWQKTFVQAHNGPQLPELYNSVIKVVNTNYPQAAPGSPQEKIRADIFQNIQRGDIEAIQKLKSSIVDSKGQQLLKIKQDPQGPEEVSDVLGRPAYASTLSKRSLSEEQKRQIARLTQESDTAKATLDAYTIQSIVNKKENQLQLKAELSPQNTKYSDLTVAAESIGREIEKTVGIQKRIPNNRYEQTKAGMEAVMTSWNMSINALMSEGMRTKNPALTNQAQEKLAQLQVLENRYANLDNQFPDVGMYKTARYLGDILSEIKPMRLLTTTADVNEAAQIAEERNPGFLKSHGKFVDLVAQSEGNWVGVKSGMVPQGGFIGGLKSGTEAVGYGGGAFIASPFGHTWDRKTLEQLEIFQGEAALKGTSASGVQPTKITYDKNNKAFREQPNEDYGKWNFNSAVYQLGNGIPKLAEWIVLDKGLGGAAKGLASVGVKGFNLVGKEIAATTGALIGSKEAGAAYQALKVPAGFEKAAGLYATTYITSFDENHKLAETLITDKTSLGEAKKNALANFLTLTTAGIFSMMDYSPTKAVEAALAKSAAPDILKTLEKANWQTLSQEETASLLKEQIWPRVKAVIQATGQSVKAGGKLGLATVADQTIKDFAAVLVNPQKAQVSTGEDNMHAFVEQVLQMTLVGIPSMVSAGRFPQSAKDALYQAGLLAPQYIDRINERAASGDLKQEQANKMIAMIKTMAGEVDAAQLARTAEDTPLTTEQKRDLALENFRKKAATHLEETGMAIGADQIHAQADEQIETIRAENHWRPVEESVPFQSARELESGKKPSSPQDIDPEKKYTYDKEGTVVTTSGAELSHFLTTGNYEQVPGTPATEAGKSKEGQTPETTPTGGRPETPPEGDAQKVTTDQLEKGKQAIEKAITEGKLTGVYVSVARDDPQGFLKEISDQVFGRLATGVKAKGPDAEVEARTQYGDDIVDAAKSLFPAEARKPVPTVLVRHGESQANARKIASTDETPLTAKGEKQATEKGKELAQQGYTDVVTSDTVRSRETAAKILEQTGGQLLEHPKLGQLLKEWEQTGGETVEQFAQRMTEARQEIAQLPPGTAVVAHGKVMGMLEALDKADGDVKKAIELFEQTKVYGNTETYIPSTPKNTQHGSQERNAQEGRSQSGLQDAEGGKERDGEQTAGGSSLGPEEPQGRSDVQGDVLNPEGAGPESQAAPSLPPEPENAPGETGSETPPEPEEPVTGIRNVVVNSERRNRDLDPVIKEASRSFPEVWERAKGLVRSGEADPRFLVENLAKTPEAIASDLDNALILMDRIDQTNQRIDVMAAIEAAQAAGNVVAEARLTDQLTAIEQRIQQNDEVADMTGGNIARSLSSRRMLATMDYSLSKMTADIRRLYGGDDPPPSTIEKLKKIEKDYADLMRKYAEREEAWKAERAAEAFAAAKAATPPKPTAGKKKIAVKGKELADRIRDLRPKGGGTAQVNLFSLPIAVYDTALVTIANLVEGGADLAQAIADTVKDIRFASDKDRDAFSAHLLDRQEREQTPTEQRADWKKQIAEKAAATGARDITKDAVTPLRKMARSHIQEGVATLEDLVSKLHEDIKDVLPDATPNDVRDAFSGYGDARLESRSELERQVRDLKKQGELLSQLEAAAQGEVPERGTRKTATPSKKVQDLRKAVEKAMKDSGISWENPPRTPQEQQQRALEAVKNRLKNQIADLTYRLQAGEGLKQRGVLPEDPETVALKGERDRLKKLVEAASVSPEEADKAKLQRLENGLKAEIARYETQIREGVDPLKPRVEQLTSPELEGLKAQRDKLRDIVRKLKIDSTPKSTMQEIALEAYKDRMTRRVEEFKRRINEGDFEPQPRKVFSKDAEAMKLSLAVKTEESKFYTLKRKAEAANRNRLQKILDGISAWKRFAILSGIPSLGKIGLAVTFRQIGTPVEEIVGSGLRLIPGVRTVAKQAPREGAGFTASAEREALASWAKADTYKDFLQVLKKGRGELDATAGKYIEDNPEVLEFWGRVHASLKNFAKRSEFARAFELRMNYAEKQGFDRSDELVRMTAAQDAYTDASRSIFMQDNALTKMYYKGLKQLEASESSTLSKLGAFLARFTMPIIKVPTNFIAETGDFAFGVGTGTYRVLSHAIQGDLKALKPAEADLIMRSLKKGSIGLTLSVVGFLLPALAGGYYLKGEKRDEEEVQPSEFMFGGHRVPKWATHFPALEAMQIGATVRRSFDRRREVKEEDPNKAVVGATWDAAGGMLGEVPLFEQPTHLMDNIKRGGWDKIGGEFLKSLNPQLIQNIASWTDREEGKTVKRDPQSIAETLMTSIPGLREMVPRK